MSQIGLREAGLCFSVESKKQETRKKCLPHAVAMQKRCTAWMQRHIVTRPLILAKQVGIAPSTIYRVLDKLEQHGIIRQNTQGERNRIYTYSAYEGMLDH